MKNTVYLAYAHPLQVGNTSVSMLLDAVHPVAGVKQELLMPVSRHCYLLKLSNHNAVPNSRGPVATS